jgi:rod shape determining protein RodA
MVLLLAAFLVAAGAVGLYSVAGGSYQPWAAQHVSRFVVMSAVALAIVLVPLRVWFQLAYPAYGLALILLALVPVAGVEAMGAQRWLSLMGFQFQPSELMKLALVAALARFLHVVPAAQFSSPRHVLTAIAMIGLPTALILRQPDLGSAVCLVVIGLALMFLSGVSLIYFGLGGVIFGCALPFIIANLHDYQRRRLMTFLDPESDPTGAGYHILQSKIALGSGGISGKGFLQGTQSQLDFLPEKHTDFVFTMLGEEWGYMGCLALILLYAAMLLQLSGMALQAESLFAKLLISGSLVTIFLYVFINIAMVTGLVPVVGVPLPLVSYGGTSLATIMIGLGLAISAHVHVREELGRQRLRG